MKTIKINQKNVDEEAWEIIIGYLKRGKIIVYPTDTIYGLGCMAADEKAIKRIIRIKKSPLNKPFIILAGSYCMLKKYCYLSQKQRNYLNTVWPGPVTVILKSRGILPKILSGDQAGLGIRLPKNKFLTTMIKKAGTPIVSTSLNIHGQKYIQNLKQAKNIFNKEKPDLIIDGGKSLSKPSKLIDISDIKNIKILRN